MQSIKAISVFAAFGFVLSLFFGLFSHSPFLIILIKALIFGALFAGAGFLISFLYEHFLSDESSDMTVEGGSEPVTMAPSSLGQKVDLTVEDKDLPEEENDNTYAVNESSHQMLNPSDLKKTEKKPQKPVMANTSQSSRKADPVDSIPEEDSAADVNAVKKQSQAKAAAAVEKPVANGQTDNPQAAEANAAAVGNKTESSETNDETLDTLPDLQSFAIDNGSSGTDNDQNESVDSDGNFSTTFVGSSQSSSKKSGSAEIQDASLMAKAISSILSNEES